jgi:Rrf2 family protein
MKLTSACLHALRALVYLALHGGEGFIPADTIAAARGLPRPFLTKGLTGLTKAGVLVTERGPNGGSRLARPARSITLLEVVEAVDGPVRGEAPWVGEDSRLDGRLQAVCDRVAEVVRRRLRRVSLADLAGEGVTMDRKRRPQLTAPEAAALFAGLDIEARLREEAKGRQRAAGARGKEGGRGRKKKNRGAESAPGNGGAGKTRQQIAEAVVAAARPPVAARPGPGQQGAFSLPRAPGPSIIGGSRLTRTRAGKR